jgi:hypothetical protein
MTAPWPAERRVTFDTRNTGDDQRNTDPKFSAATVWPVPSRRRGAG